MTVHIKQCILLFKLLLNDDFVFILCLNQKLCGVESAALKDKPVCFVVVVVWHQACKVL